jgi:nucleotide-binding universal stress UspA family protein
MGSTTKGMVAKATCPVLAIPEKSLFRGINQIVYASDFNQNDIEALKGLTAFAQKSNAKLSVLHIFNKKPVKDSETEDFQRQLTEKVKYEHLKYDSRISDNLAESLSIYLRDSNADLLVMFEKENAGMINLLFHKDMVKHFAVHTTIPLMSYNMLSIK